MSRKKARLIKLSLPPEALTQLALLADTRTCLSELATCLAELPLDPKSDDDAEHIADRLQCNVEIAEQLLWAVHNLFSLKSKMQLDSAALLNILTENLKSDAHGEWQERNLQAWKDAIPTIQELLDTLNSRHPLVVRRKAERLQFARQNVFSQARIITDLRPVFDSEGSEILESLVLHTLVINYSDAADEDRRMAFALDLSDVASLRRACERAEGKAAALRESLKDMKWPTFELGGET